MRPILTRALIDADTRDRAPGNPIRFTIASGGEKRDGLDLDMSRFQLGNFNRNPVLLWMHGRESRGSLPLGRWQNLARSEDSISGEAVFDQEDAFAVEVESKYRRGFLNAVSVSWLPQRVEDGWRYDMLEASAVGVPADPDALVVGRDFLTAVSEFEERERSGLTLENVLVHLRASIEVEPRPDLDGILSEQLARSEAFRAATAKALAR